MTTLDEIATTAPKNSDSMGRQPNSRPAAVADADHAATWTSPPTMATLPTRSRSRRDRWRPTANSRKTIADLGQP